MRACACWFFCICVSLILCVGVNEFMCLYVCLWVRAFVCACVCLRTRKCV